MVIVRLVDALSYFDEVQILMAREHQMETEAHFSEHTPEPDVELYQALADSGQLVAVGAFDGSVLVGYCMAYVTRVNHYAFFSGVHDVLYLRPEYRRGGTALRMMKLVEYAAKQKGAVYFFWRAKPDSQFERLLAKMKYAVEEISYRKDL